MRTPRYVHRHVVTLDETNLVGNVYFAHYLHWQGHCRERFLADHAPGIVHALQDASIALVTISCAMDYYAECFALDAVEVRMSLAAAGGNRVSMAFDFVKDEQLVARGKQTVACMARAGGRMLPSDLPAELVTALNAFR